MYTRILSSRLPQKSFFLFGPRQTGKSTLLKKEKADIVIDLLNPEQQLRYNKTPSLLRQQVTALPKDATIFIDEIQRVPRLLDVIHALMEHNPQWKFILCGSSARKVRHGAANLLGGRALYRTLHPLTHEELADTFRLSLVLTYGSLPKIYTTLMDDQPNEAEDLLRSYVITYLKEEIKAEALVKNLQGFQNFLDVAAAQYGEQINFSSLARDCHVALATVREYYTILEDTLLGSFLYPYLRSPRKRMSHQPKFYFFDNGVTRALLGTLKDPPTLPEQGRLFEQWIIQEVIRYNDYYQKDWKLFFWRTSSGTEVDLLISRGRRLLYAIECKVSDTISTSDLSGLRSFHQVHPDIPCFIVAPVQYPFFLSFARVVPPHILFQEIKKL